VTLVRASFTPVSPGGAACNLSRRPWLGPLGLSRAEFFFLEFGQVRTLKPSANLVRTGETPSHPALITYKRLITAVLLSAVMRCYFPTKHIQSSHTAYFAVPAYRSKPPFPIKYRGYPPFIEGSHLVRTRYALRTCACLAARRRTPPLGRDRRLYG
jgi:hypothetical protein